MRAYALRPKKERRTGLALYRQIQAEGYAGGLAVPPPDALLDAAAAILEPLALSYAAHRVTARATR